MRTHDQCFLTIFTLFHKQPYAPARFSRAWRLSLIGGGRAHGCVHRVQQVDSGVALFSGLPHQCQGSLNMGYTCQPWRHWELVFLSQKWLPTGTVQTATRVRGQGAQRPEPQACKIIKCFYFNHMTLQFVSDLTEVLVFLRSTFPCNSSMNWHDSITCQQQPYSTCPCDFISTITF